MVDSLATSFALDRRWFNLRGEMERSKEDALRTVVAVLDESSVPYVIIGGIALQLHRSEPRTTLDIDLAVPDRAMIPSAALTRAGFVYEGTHAHSTNSSRASASRSSRANWKAQDGTPVQFTDDALFRGPIEHAESRTTAGFTLRILRVEDLLVAKFAAARDPARRRSKRAQDIADILALIDDHPELEATITNEERRLVGLDGRP